MYCHDHQVSFVIWTALVRKILLGKVTCINFHDLSKCQNFAPSCSILRVSAKAAHGPSLYKYTIFCCCSYRNSFFPSNGSNVIIIRWHWKEMQHLTKIWDNLDKISHNFRNSVKLMIQVTLSTKLYTNAVPTANKTWWSWQYVVARVLESIHRWLRNSLTKLERYVHHPVD